MSQLSINPDQVHRRRNALTGEWVLVSPHRAKRPWQGKVEAVAPVTRPRYDPNCYLCPGNTRASGQKNPAYSQVFVFDNDFAALVGEENESVSMEYHSNPGTAGMDSVQDTLFTSHIETGTCRVVCFSPHHDLTLAEMDCSAIERVVEVWADEYAYLGEKPGINYVQIFENKGDLMGCSNPHPHGQIWAQHTLPNEPAKEAIQLKLYWDTHQRTLLSDYLEAEITLEERIVCTNEHFVALVPYWALWPFETMVITRRPVSSIQALHAEERSALADMLSQLTTKYDNLFEISFPYSAGIHQAPTDGVPHPEWHLHMHFYPPLLRSATVKKFMVGYEMLGEPQRDLTAETSAQRLRACASTHYKSGHAV